VPSYYGCRLDEKIKSENWHLLGKDLEFYRKEERAQTEKIEKMKKEQADSYSIKKQAILN